MLYTDKDGKTHHPIMGCYGIGVGRLAASVCEERHDEYGPIWPISIAPWEVQLCCLRADNAEVKEVADGLYDQLQKAGVEVIYDDRNVRPGEMFADAGAGYNLLIAGGYDIVLNLQISFFAIFRDTFKPIFYPLKISDAFRCFFEIFSR